MVLTILQWYSNIVSMKRSYQEILSQHFADNRQIVFLIGPRQVGKTTIALQYGQGAGDTYYFSWDVTEDRLLILEGPHAVAREIGLDKARVQPPLVIFDEIHKFPQWKLFIKGFFDVYERLVRIIVTSSARLDVIHRGGESLMGRYFPYHVHPLSVRELLGQTLPKKEFFSPKKLSKQKFQDLLRFGGFPEPYVRKTDQFYHRWKRLRLRQLIYDEVSDLTQIQYLDRLELLAKLLRFQIGQLTSYQSLSKKLQCANNTIRNWISVLTNLYYCFEIRPWTKNVSRSLLKEPKFYLWDWSWCEDEGARFENFIASHVLKAVHYWTDMGLGDYELYFLRDKEKREVDFLITKNQKPWVMIEAKNRAQKALSSSFHHFYDQLAPVHAFQVVNEMPYVEIDCFAAHRPLIVPASTLLSQLI